MPMALSAQRPTASGRRTGRSRRPAPPVDAAAAERGRLFFAQTCSFCHGIDARGGAEGGSDLTRSPIVLADPTGGQLGEFLQVGRPDKKMPAFPLPPGAGVGSSRCSCDRPWLPAIAAPQPSWSAMRRPVRRSSTAPATARSATRSPAI